MISVVIPTKNSESQLFHNLAALVPAAAAGVIREVIVVDAGSTDKTDQVADASGCEWVVLEAPHSERLVHGASLATRGDWLLFLRPETLLESEWYHEVKSFLEQASLSPDGLRRTAFFRRKPEGFGMAARVRGLLAATRSQLLGMPYGDQGLLISRQFYQDIGGYRPLPDLEDLDIAKRIGRRRMVFLKAAAMSSGKSEQAEGNASLRKSLARACVCLLRLPVSIAVRLYV